MTQNKTAAPTLDHAATARKIAWMHGNQPGLAGDVERALRDAERAGRRAGEGDAERLREACEGALAIAEDRQPGTRDDVMLTMRRVLRGEDV